MVTDLIGVPVYIDTEMCVIRLIDGKNVLVERNCEYHWTTFDKLSPVLKRPISQDALASLGAECNMTGHSPDVFRRVWSRMVRMLAKGDSVHYRFTLAAQEMVNEAKANSHQ